MAQALPYIAAAISAYTALKPGPKIPKPAPEEVQADPEDLAAKRAAQREQKRRQGASQTVLTGGSSTLG